MTEIAIALNRPALTPEVRAWINNRPGKKRPVLTRGHVSDLNRGAALLRIDVDGATDEEVRDEVEGLLTDLRMLGLAPKLLEQNPA
ncbi:MAG TPA: hypothetical protein VHU61_17365 [Solirubrobacteraceae bacterium]|nr:hypothetical protein [Solirubrobacteraceae bacterium]